MRITGAIYDPAVIRKILRHVGLWDVPARAPPRRVWKDGDLIDIIEPVPQEEAPDPWLDAWPDTDPTWDD